MEINKIFISHAYHYTVNYYTIEKWLNAEMNSGSGFNWLNCSVTRYDNDNMTNKIYKQKLKEQIHSSSIFIVISDIYTENKYWMDYEINTAKHNNKYIIGLKPWRSMYVTPKKISKNADMLINLNSNELINTINLYK